MCRIAIIGSWAAAAIFAACAAAPAGADSLEVSPTTLTLDAQRAGVLNVVNRGDEPITAQFEAFDWRQEGGKDRLDQSRTLQVSPPIVHLAPGEKQIVRVRAALGSSSASEQAFRLVASELPNPSGKYANGVHLLLQFKVPVFVGGTDRTPRQLSWKAIPTGNDLILRVSNDSSRHVKLARLQVLTHAGQSLTIEPESFYYVLAGATSEWAIREAGVTPDAKLRVVGVDETNGTRIDDALVAGR